MRATDAWAISERGVPSLELMEAAGLALAEAAQAAAATGPDPDRLRQGQQRRRRAGRGSPARRLGPRGRGAAAVAGRRAVRRCRGQSGAPRRPPFRELGGDDAAAALDGSGAIVDAIFGTGFEGSPRDPAAAAIEAINGCGAPVVAADIASGVDASTGEVAGAAVEAAITVSFHAAKLGHWIAPGKRRTGRAAGGADRDPARRPGRGARRADPRPRCSSCCARRGADSTKFSSGQVLVAGGSRGLTGAVCMVVACGDPRRRRLRDRRRAGGARGDLRDQADRGDVGRLPERRRPPDAATPPSRSSRRPTRAAAVVLGPGLGRAEDELRAGRRGRAAVRGAPGARRRRAQRARRAARAARRARGPDGAHPARRRARAAARRRAPTRLEPGASPARPRRPSAPGRSSCSRATTRSSPLPASGSIVNGAREPGAGDRGDRRRAQRDDRGADRARAGAVRRRPPRPSTRTPAPGAPPPAAIGAPESVIAGDVIEAIPAGLAPGGRRAREGARR